LLTEVNLMSSETVEPKADPVAEVVEEIKHNPSRPRNNSFVKAIVYGTKSWTLPKKSAEDDQLYSWILYVKPYFEENLENYIDKVIFTLHESYNQPVRVCRHPPYSVSEVGWGEFKAVITFKFKGVSKHMVRIYKKITLFDPHIPDFTETDPLVDEHYGELLFENAPLVLQRHLRIDEGKTKVVGNHSKDHSARRMEIRTLVDAARQYCNVLGMQVQAENSSRQKIFFTDY
ncbi:YEATS domain-containing protein 4, partial [Trichinella sp. T6]